MLLRLLQIVDSSFPNGSFSHSFGLETALSEARIRSAADLFDWLVDYARGGIAGTDGPGVYWAYHYATELLQGEGKRIPGGERDERGGVQGLDGERGERDHAEEHSLGAELLARITDLDERLTLSRLASESRQGSIKIGKRYLRLVRELYPESGLNRYEQLVRTGVCYGQASVVHGWVCAFWQLPVEEAVSSYVYAALNSLVQNALRAMSLGQTDAQLVLQRLIPVATAVAQEVVSTPPLPEDFWTCTLAQEIQAMRHQFLYTRLFMS